MINDLRKWRWLGPIPAACLLYAAFGLMFANGIYVALLDRPALTWSIGLAMLCMAAGCTFGGIMLHHSKSEAEYRRKPRLLATVCGLMMGGQAVMARAVAIGFDALLFFAAATYGLATGFLYIIALTILHAWAPERLGFITALGMLFLPLGSTLGAVWYSKTAVFLGGAVPAMTATGLITSVSVILAAQFLDRPPPGWHPHSANKVGSGNAKSSKCRKLSVVQNLDYGSITNDKELDLEKGNRETSSAEGEALTLKEMMQSPVIYPFMMALCAITVPGSGVAMGFPSMLSLSFGLPVQVGNSWVVWVLLPGIFGRLISGFIVDWLVAKKRGVMVLPDIRLIVRLIHFIQVFAIALMSICIYMNCPLLFTVGAGAVMFSFSAGAVSSACLVRYMFTTLNSSLAFSTLGLSSGFADLLQMTIISQHTVGHISQSIGAPKAQPHAFDSFLLLSGVIAIAGAISSFYLTVDKRAYEKAKISCTI